MYICLRLNVSILTHRRHACDCLFRQQLHKTSTLYRSIVRKKESQLALSMEKKLLFFETGLYQCVVYIYIKFTYQSRAQRNKLMLYWCLVYIKFTYKSRAQRNKLLVYWCLVYIKFTYKSRAQKKTVVYILLLHTQLQQFSI